MKTVTGIAYATQAMSDQYTGIPYTKLDCQAFVEQVLKDCGVRKADGSPYNWAGSNSMWRNALAWKGTVEECRTVYGEIPVGAWVFIVKNDGGEKLRGYNDNEGNASHVGIYCRHNLEQVRDSTRTTNRNGVGYRELKGFTHVGLPKMIDYNNPSIPDTSSDAINAVRIIRKADSSDSEILKALQTLTKYLKGS